MTIGTPEKALKENGNQSLSRVVCWKLVATVSGGQKNQWNACMNAQSRLLARFACLRWMALVVLLLGAANPALAGIQSLSAGDYHLHAITTDGRVLFWGNATGCNNYFHYSPNMLVDVGITDVVSIAAGADSSLLVKADGTVVGCGANSDGQLGNGRSGSNVLTPSAVKGLSNVVSVSITRNEWGGAFSGYKHAVALLANGTVMTWGSNELGQLGDGTTTPRLLPEPVPGLSNVVAVGAGTGYTVALKSDGNVVTWGGNSSIPIPVLGLSGVTKIAVGESHVLAIKTDKTIVTWGGGSGLTPTPVIGLTDVIGVAAGTRHSVAVKADGTVYAWGSNQFGQIGDGTSADRNLPIRVPGVTGVVAVAASSASTFALKSDGTLMGWGNNRYGELGDGTTRMRNVPGYVGPRLQRVLPTGSEWVGADRKPILTNGTGRIRYAFATYLLESPYGDSDYESNLTGLPLEFTSLTPSTCTMNGDSVSTVSAGTCTVKVRQPGNEWFLPAETTTSFSVGFGKSHEIWPFYAPTVLVGDTGRVGADSIYRLSEEQSTNIGATHLDGILYSSLTPPTCSVSGSQVSGLAVGICSIAIYHPGNNIYNPAYPRVLSFEISPAVPDSSPPPLATQIIAGEYHSMALYADGQVIGWGSTAEGVLGNGLVPSDPLKPAKPVSLDHVTKIAAATWGNFAIKSDGTVYGWGRNEYGQLGDGTFVERWLPASLPALKGVLQIAGSQRHAIALKPDGTVLAWGSNFNGELGDGTTLNRTIPGLVSNLGGVVAVSTGGAGTFSAALKSDGTVVEWGTRDSGATRNLVPVPVSGLSNVVAISVGGNRGLALKSDGTVMTWGDGQVGAVPVTGLSSVVSVSAGDLHNVVVLSDGRVALWGSNAYGQLGDGTISGRGNPVIIPGLTGVVEAVAGGAHTVVRKNDGTLMTWGLNDSGQLRDGTTSNLLSPAPVLKTRFKQQVVDIAPVPAIVIGDTVNLSAATTSGLAVTVNAMGGSLNSTCGYEGGALVAATGGWCAINANQAGDATYESASARVNVFIPRRTQTITFGPLPALIVGRTDRVSATSDGFGGDVLMLSLTPEICAVGDRTETYSNGIKVSIYDVTGIAIGTCVIAANQWGDSIYSDAAQITNSITVGRGSQSIGTIGFAPGALAVGGATTLSAIATSGLAVTFGSTTLSTCVVSGSTVSGVAAGICTVAANQTGNANYAAAAQVTNNITVAATLPAVSLGPNGLSFAPQNVGTTSTAGSITLSNTGTGTLNITSITPNGDYAGTTNCIATLAAGATCSVNVTFTPKAAGIRTGSFIVASNAAGSPHSVSLTGAGTLVPQSLGTIGFTPGSLVVGGATTASATATSGLAVTFNSKTSSICIVSGNTVTAVAAGVCTIAATQPGNANYSAATQVTNNITVVTPSVVSLSPTSLSFGSQNLSTTSAAQSITLSNTGSGALRISSITDSGDYARTTTCGATLAAGANCIINVTFTPTATGTRAGAITISSNATGSPHSVSVSGTGLVVPGVSLSPARLTFGSQNTSNTSVPETITLSNTGSGTINIAGILASDDYARTTTCGSNLAAGASCTISVTFTPTAAGARTGAIAIASNAIGSPHSVPLSGVGTLIAQSIGAISFSSRSVAEGTTTTLSAKAGSGLAVTFSSLTPATCTVAGNTVTGVEEGTCAIAANQAGNANYSAAPQVTDNIAVTVTTLRVAAMAAAGRNHTVALNADGTIVAWGYNSGCQLGDGTFAQSLTPKTVPALTGVVAVTAGDSDVVALKHDGTVVAWGYNPYGGLGVDSLVVCSPVAIPGLVGVVAVAAGAYHTVAVKGDGTVVAWGFNSYGQIGDGTKMNRVSPVTVPELTDVVSVAASQAHTVALKADGTVMAWGFNASGQLGDGTTMNRLSPVAVPGLTDVVAVGAGGSHTIALKADGTVIAWGGNYFGQLGDGTTTNRLRPVAVPGLTDVVAVGGGGSYTVALKADGTVVAWGLNASGQLGDGTTVDRSSPVAVLGLTGVVAVSAGDQHSVALKFNGTVMSWGSNGGGQLGDSTTTDQPSPVVLAGGLNLGNATPRLSLSPTFLSYAGQDIWSSSAAQSITLTNTSDAFLYTPVIFTNGDYSRTTTCGLSLAAGASCSASVSITPTATGSRSGSLVAVINNTVWSLAALTGNGTLIPQSINALSFTPGSLTAGGTVTASATATLGLAVTFSSATPSTCSMSGSTVTAVDAGTCTIVANQAGNASYSPAPQVMQSITVGSTSMTTSTTTTTSSTTTTTQVGTNINLVPSWNLVGNGVEAPIVVATTFNDASKVATIWKWITSGSTAGIAYPAWAFYTPSLPDGGQAYAASKGYDYLSTINAGEGFWVNSKTAFSVAMPNGAQVQSISYQAGGTHAMPSGWNLIAIGDNLSPTGFNARLSTTPPGAGTQPLNVLSLWAWDVNNSGWYFWAPSLVNNATLASYITAKGYLDFATIPSTPAGRLSPTTGFWVNVP